VVARRLAEAETHVRAGRTGKAEAAYRQVVRRSPTCAPALHALGLLARGRGQLSYAVQLLARAADAAPTDAAVASDLGLALKAAGRHDEALERLDAVARRLAPHAPEAHANLGVALNAAGRAAEAVAAFRAAVALRPHDPELHYNLGNGLLAAGAPADAEAAYRWALGIAPWHARARTNLGSALKEQGRLAEAAACFAEALARDPGCADAGWNLALAHLARGDWRDGWRLYEWRRSLADFALRRIDAPAWDGSPLAGRALLVHAEQGLGDTLQFLRYLPLLADRGGEVAFLCQPALAPLLAGARGLPRVVTEPPRRFDVQAPLLSLPHLLDRPQPFAPVPYLAADATRIARWRDRLPQGGRTLGIAWQGRADYRDDRRRSIPLAAFAPLATLAGVRLVSLQKGFGTEQLATAAWRDQVIDFGAGLDRDGAFVDSAAILQSLDLVVTSDTALAHLAGALGRPVWVALCRRPDWRWGEAGDGSPWYPTMRLFRQDAPGDWADVFARIAAALNP
jgi:Flp pilus assembly protein TadD